VAQHPSAASEPTEQAQASDDPPQDDPSDFYQDPLIEQALEIFQGTLLK